MADGTIMLVMEYISRGYFGYPLETCHVNATAYTTEEDAVKGLHMFMNRWLTPEDYDSTLIYKRTVVYDKGDRAKIRIYRHPSKKDLEKNPKCPDRVTEVLWLTKPVGLNVGSDHNYEL